MGKLDVVSIGESMIVFNPLVDVGFVDSHLFLKQVGGAESNFAIGLSRLGHKVGWISRLGNDSLGYFIHNMIRGNGVDTKYVEFDNNHPTGILIKERFINQNNIHYYRENSAASKMTPLILDEKYISQAKYLFITGITPILSESCKNLILESINIARNNGVKIVFDPNLRFKLVDDLEQYRNLMNNIVKSVDYFLPGISEAKFLSEFEDLDEIVDFFLKLNPNLVVVIKLGSEGSFYEHANERKKVPAIKVDKVVDPIGAGDAFAAGFVSGLLEGKSLEESIRKGNILGAITVQSAGDVEGFPHIKQFENYIKSLKSVTEEVNR